MNIPATTTNPPRFNLDSIHFLKSAAKLAQCPEDIGMEVAFCGRSNAGKSSAINYLTGQHKLARTSRTPGRTQLINFFTISEQLRLVDLPGYGYAKVPTAMKREWHENIDKYLRNRLSLCGLVLLMDIRHPLKPFDHTMLDWCAGAGMPLHILLTKCDKLKRGGQQNALLHVKKHVGDLATVQLFSSTHGVGQKILLHKLSGWLTAEDHNREMSDLSLAEPAEEAGDTIDS
ncbi:MAG: ribosome biogenesis GTP-binding protein YihA/YsxC [Pseudomonadales bacterium]|nr:ribosome biogenesis GTP-binding protein YihA/YsxC [Pseudomonadales bacterium]MDP4874458.1 ribosome biogenesis GTP-binding protein YihA/YsxC [Pseudomonadales bacterium]MDP4910500.1 ribosome biogenesis GTP-binding protein YihA/YsxC [Pseudomonadales bacterium]MDP5059393.1 ribosome biogenesis GTP-binding protein YihA/YsxC [Pseudomonadales bacterium]